MTREEMLCIRSGRGIRDKRGLTNGVVVVVVVGFILVILLSYYSYPCCWWSTDGSRSAAEG